MTSHEWFVEHRTAFVTRTLETDEERLFADHLPRCEECRREVARQEGEFAWLPLGVTPVAVRPGLRRRISDRVLGINRWRWNAMATVTMAASVLLAVLAYGVGRRSESRLLREADTLRTRLARSETERGALEDTVSIMRGATRVLQASFTMENQPGGLLFFADARTHRWNVVVHGLPPAGPERVYQFWFIQRDGMVRGALIHPDSTRPTFMTMGMPPNGKDVVGAALTIEPMERVPGDHPQGKELAHLML
jgi:hypothetical protein